MTKVLCHSLSSSSSRSTHNKELTHSSHCSNLLRTPRASKTLQVRWTHSLQARSLKTIFQTLNRSMGSNHSLVLNQFGIKIIIKFKEVSHSGWRSSRIITNRFRLKLNHPELRIPRQTRWLSCPSHNNNSSNNKAMTCKGQLSWSNKKWISSWASHSFHP